MAILEAKCLKKIYTTRFGGNQVQALSNVSFSVEEGEYVAIMGESGSGKTTLLNILAALDKPTGGEVILDGRNPVSYTHLEIRRLKDTETAAAPRIPFLMRSSCFAPKFCAIKIENAFPKSWTGR